MKSTDYQDDLCGNFSPFPGKFAWCLFCAKDIERKESLYPPAIFSCVSFSQKYARLID